MRSLVFRLLNYKRGHIGICFVSSAGRKCTREPKPQRDTASAFAYAPSSLTPQGSRRTVPEEHRPPPVYDPGRVCRYRCSVYTAHLARSRMAWRLWKTEKRQDETRCWPSDTHRSIKQLLGMYLSGGSAPFARWAAPGITLMPDVEPVLRNGVREYQLALWFWRFAEKNGTIAAHMVREGIVKLAPGSTNIMGHGESFRFRFAVGRGADFVQGLSISAAHHQLRGVAVLPVPAQPAHG
ncbi:hypothetical protein OKW37_000468 [Paraburkholderia sp. MM5482-R2]